MAVGPSEPLKPSEDGEGKETVETVGDPPVERHLTEVRR
jgi:hypothetical protein